MARAAFVPRTLSRMLERAARQFPVLVLTGPRQAGKSTLLKKVFPRHHYVTLDDLAQRALARRDPALFVENLDGDTIIDGIQYAPGILSAIKLAVDAQRGRPGRFLLTGSQVFPLMAGVSESLAGRAALFELLGFSWEELGAAGKPSARECFRRMFKGFYPDPAVHGVDPKTFYGSYLQTYLERDVRQIRSVHDLSQFQSFLELLAARSGGLLNLSELGKECGVSQTTAKQWVSILESTRIIYLLRPYFRNISKRVVKSPKVYFTDTGLLAHLLKYPNSETMLAGPMAGAFFETLVVIELLKRKFHHHLAYELYFFRDSHGNEIDLLVDLGPRRILAEIKLSKTPRLEHAKVFTRLAGAFPGAETRVLSLAEEELPLSRAVRSTPWWGFRPA